MNCTLSAPVVGEHRGLEHDRLALDEAGADGAVAGDGAQAEDLDVARRGAAVSGRSMYTGARDARWRWYARSTSSGVPDVATRPFSSSIARSQRRSTELGSCETNTIVPPARLKSQIRPWHFCWKASSPTASTSSSSRMSGWMCIATEKPRRRYMPDEYVLTAWSANSSSSAKAMISSRCSSM